MVFSGGEPTYQRGLPEAAVAIRSMGFDVAVHTNGYSADALGRLLAGGAVSYVAMDVKARFEQYERVTRVPGSGRGPEDCVRLLTASGVAHEFRTTYHPGLLSLQDIRRIALALHSLGARAYRIQAFRQEGCLDAALRNCPQSAAALPGSLLDELGALFPRFGLRGFAD